MCACACLRTCACPSLQLQHKSSCCFDPKLSLQLLDPPFVTITPSPAYAPLSLMSLMIPYQKLSSPQQLKLSSLHSPAPSLSPVVKSSNLPLNPTSQQEEQVRGYMLTQQELGVGPVLYEGLTHLGGRCPAVPEEGIVFIRQLHN